MAPSPPRARRRVLFMIDYAVSTGGAERFVVGLASWLPQDRFEPWVCATRASDPTARDALADAGVQLVDLGRRGRWDLQPLAKLASLLRSQAFDVLHAHKFGSNLWGTLIGSACQVPRIVAHEHSWSYQGNPPRAWIDGQVISRLADRFVAVSSADGRRMVSTEHVDPRKVVVIPNGYIPSPLQTDSDIRAELGLAADSPVIAVAAVLRPEKRLDLLLRAVAQVQGTVPDVQLVIAGDGDCRSELEQLARELGLAQAVHFLGKRADVDSVLRAADVGAMMSDREGSPLFIFECMANGIPVVATAVGGIPDVVVAGETGLLVPRRDHDALAHGLADLLSHAERRHAMGEAARRRLSGYTIETTARRVADLYDELLATP